MARVLDEDEKVASRRARLRADNWSEDDFDDFDSSMGEISSSDSDGDGKRAQSPKNGAVFVSSANLRSTGMS